MYIKSLFSLSGGLLLYSVNHSYPFSSNGYATRTHGVAAALVAQGVRVVAASRPGMPWAMPGFDARGFATTHVIDGVRYVHQPFPQHSGMSETHYLEECVSAWAELIAVFKPSVVVAASNWRSALPVAKAAQQAGLPFAYEVRGFWEISRLAREPQWQHSPEFAHAVEQESAIAQAAQQVFTLNRFMAQELVRRGVQPERIALIPNGFVAPSEQEAERSQPAPALMLEKRTRFMVGYTGSFNGYEGLELLIKALALLRQQGLDVSVLLLGSGERTGLASNQPCAMTQAYRQLAQQLGVADYLLTPGRVSPDAVAAYYAQLDVMVIPRLPLQVCELVSPMKPLEAAAKGKQVLMSDVAPLADLANLCQNFHYFEKGNVQSLAQQLAKLLEAGDFSPPPCMALRGMSWQHNVQPMLRWVQSWGKSC